MSGHVEPFESVDEAEAALIEDIKMFHGALLGDQPEVKRALVTIRADKARIAELEAQIKGQSASHERWVRSHASYNEHLLAAIEKVTPHWAGWIISTDDAPEIILKQAERIASLQRLDNATALLEGLVTPERFVEIGKLEDEIALLKTALARAPCEIKGETVEWSAKYGEAAQHGFHDCGTCPPCFARAEANKEKGGDAQ